MCVCVYTRLNIVTNIVTREPAQLLFHELCWDYRVSLSNRLSLSPSSFPLPFISLSFPPSLCSRVVYAHTCVQVHEESEEFLSVLFSHFPSYSLEARSLSEFELSWWILPSPLSHPGVAEVAGYVQPHPDFCLGNELMVWPQVLTLLQQVLLLTESPSQPYITL